jgi:hypothetical protein
MGDDLAEGGIQPAHLRIGGSEGHKGREAAGAALGLLATLRAI